MSDSICFHNIQGGLFKIDEAVVIEMRRHIQDDRLKPEAGGVLLGRFIVGTVDVVVDQVTVPMPGDKRSLLHFNRAARNHQAVIDRRWVDSKHTCNYLGGWHTHPEPFPIPSWIDRMDWRRALRKNRFDGETLYFIIIGTREIRVWEGNRHAGKIVELIPVNH